MCVMMMENAGNSFPAFFVGICRKNDILLFKGLKNMKMTVERLRNKDQTGKEMHRLIRNYSADLHSIYVRKNGQLVPFSSLSLMDAFDLIRRIPYRRDVKPIEVISRPNGILKNAPLGMDCKKKAILIAAYLKERGIPFRLIASSRKRNRRIHHVFPQLNFAGKWMNADATYPHYRLFQQKPVTRAEVLK